MGLSLKDLMLKLERFLGQLITNLVTTAGIRLHPIKIFFLVT